MNSTREEGFTKQGRPWVGTVIRRSRKGRLVSVRLPDCLGATGFAVGQDCDWDPSESRRNKRNPTREDMQNMADQAEQRWLNWRADHQERES